MKRISLAVLAVLLTAFLALPVFAAESQFTVLTDAENGFIYKNDGSWDAGDSRVADETQSIIYVFTLDAGDTWASLTLPICNQYKIEASKGDPDDAGSYRVLAEKEPTDDEKATMVPFWGTAPYENPTAVDLTDFCKDNAAGKIYVRLSDAAPTNGWGSKIMNTAPVVFSHGASSAIPETQVFHVQTADEAGFVYKDDRTWCDSNNRICDNDTTITYVFNLVSGANYAELDINIHNQYKIEVATADPDNASSYTVVEQLEIPATANLADEPWWGSSDAYELHKIDLSDYCSAGRIYVKIGDVTPDTGWGGKIEGEVKFISKYEAAPAVAPVVTPAEPAPTETVSENPVPADEAPVETAPAAEAPLEAEPAAAPVSAPKTSDRFAGILVLSAIAAGAVVFTKKH